jgi:hypothetical protein
MPRKDTNTLTNHGTCKHNVEWGQSKNIVKRKESNDGETKRVGVRRRNRMKQTGRNMAKSKAGVEEENQMENKARRNRSQKKGRY